MQKYIEIWWLQDYNQIHCIYYFLDQYKTFNCKSTNKNSVYNKWYYTYHHSLENLNQFFDKIIKTFYSVNMYIHKFDINNMEVFRAKWHNCYLDHIAVMLLYLHIAIINLRLILTFIKPKTLFHSWGFFLQFLRINIK